METKFIANVNGVDLVATKEQLVPIKPICDALGVDAKAQRNRIERDEILSSTGVIMTSVAADGKEREMMCLPLLYVFGWLFTIDASRVNEEARDSVIRYKRECYDALCNHFIGSVRQFKEDKQLEISLLEELNEYTALRDDTNKKISATRRKLDKLREKWMKGETLFD